MFRNSKLVLLIKKISFKFKKLIQFFKVFPLCRPHKNENQTQALTSSPISKVNKVARDRQKQFRLFSQKGVMTLHPKISHNKNKMVLTSPPITKEVGKKTQRGLENLNYFKICNS